MQIKIRIKKVVKSLYYVIRRKCYILFELLSIKNLIIINHKKFLIPYISGCSMKVDEKWMTEIITKSISMKTGIFLDIGANLGQTLLALKSVNRSNYYLGIEPNYFALHYLNELIKINNLQYKTHILPGALTTEEGFSNLDFYNPILSDSSASIINKFRTNENVEYSQEVSNITSRKIEDLILNKKISTIKIDVEGAEYKCISCLKELIIRDKPFILVEILPVYSADNLERHKNQEKILKLLKSIEYTCFRIIKNKKNYISHFQKFENIGIHSDISLCDYIFVPKDKLKVFHKINLVLNNNY